MSLAVVRHRCVTGLVSEHDMLVNTVMKFDKALEEGNRAQIEENGQELCDFLCRGMREHFLLEEEVFFPAFCLSIHSLETSRLVLRLQKEHGVFEKDAELLKQLITRQSLREALGSQLFVETFRTFMDRLRDHAVAEINQLFPLIDKNRQCSRLVEKLVAERARSEAAR